MSINFPFFSRLKIEELEAERCKLEEENRSLETKLEKLTLQVGSVGVQCCWRAGHGPFARAARTDVPECSQRAASLPSNWAGRFLAACANRTNTAASLTVLLERFDVRCSHTNAVDFFDAFA